MNTSWFPVSMGTATGVLCFWEWQKVRMVVDRLSFATSMFNPKSIDPTTFYSAFTPASKGSLWIATPPEPSDGYSIATNDSILVLSTDCYGVRVDDRNPAYDRETPGAVDKVIYRCMVKDATAARAIESGQYARIERLDGLKLQGVVDLVEYRVYGGIRVYIDCGVNVPIDWESLDPSVPSPTPIPTSPIADMTSDSIIVPYHYTDSSPKLIFNNTAMRTIFIAKIVVQIPFNDPNAELFLGDYAQFDRLLSSTQINPTVDPSVAGEYQTSPAWRPANFNEMQTFLTINPGISTQGQGFVRLELSNY